jgi:glycerol-3-phosphate dehydrogenase
VRRQRDVGARARRRSPRAHALRRRDREGGLWLALLEGPSGREEVRARAIVNAAGPWVADVLRETDAKPTGASVRHVKGSHIVVPRVHPEEHAYILQNSDNRIVFVIPYQEHYSLIGTTDVPVEEYDVPRISDDETDYLIALANAYLAKAARARRRRLDLRRACGPLYDDGRVRPVRDHARLRAQGRRARRAAGAGARAGAVDLRRQDHDLPQARRGRAARARAVLPGDEGRVDRRRGAAGRRPRARRPRALLASLCSRYPSIPVDLLRPLARRHGTLAVDGARRRAHARRPRRVVRRGLTAREVDYLVEHEWAHAPDDVLWRRTKCGLPMTARAARARAGAYSPQLARRR